MRKHISFKMIFTVLIIFTAVVYFGCEKKTDDTEVETDNTKTENIIPDIKGTWTGTFDSRSTVLNITEQTDSSFTGKISISYRQAINQDVKGFFSPTTMSMEMIDQLHSRFQGKYNGKLSEDGNKYSGTFIMDLDGSKFSFNLNKK